LNKTLVTGAFGCGAAFLISCRKDELEVPVRKLLLGAERKTH
jgi:hypothetical protein